MESIESIEFEEVVDKKGETAMSLTVLNEEDLMWIFNALCDYHKNHSKNLNEKSIESLRRLIKKVADYRGKPQ